jgi:hypothetical protein
MSDKLKDTTKQNFKHPIIEKINDDNYNIETLPSTENIKSEEPVKKKRGRKPKIRTPEEIEEMQRKAKNKSKRGRKPKGKFKENTTSSLEHIMMNINSTKDIIIKLPLTCEELTHQFNLDTNLIYSPTITDPEPYNYNINNNFEEYEKVNDDITSQNTTTNNNLLHNNNNDDLNNNNINNNRIYNLPQQINFENLNTDDLNYKSINNIQSSDKSNDNNSKDINTLVNNCINDNKERNKQLKQIDILINNKYKQISSLGIFSSDNNKFKKTKNQSHAACFWCCHDFDNNPWGVPQRYNLENDTFICFGNFCSPNCTISYINEKYGNNTNKWEYISLLNFMYYKAFNNDDIIIPAPEKYCLQKFGGRLTIEEYRMLTLNNNKLYYVNFPICLNIMPVLQQKKNTLTQDSYFIPKDEQVNSMIKTKYKIKRNKPIYAGKNTLEKCLLQK